MLGVFFVVVVVVFFLFFFFVFFFSFKIADGYIVAMLDLVAMITKVRNISSYLMFV